MKTVHPPSSKSVTSSRFDATGRSAAAADRARRELVTKTAAAAQHDFEAILEIKVSNLSG
jgi:hypothetical protein